MSYLTRKYFSRLNDTSLSGLAKTYLRCGKLSQETVREIQEYYITTQIFLDSGLETEKMALWSDNSQAPSLAVNELIAETMYRFSNQIEISMHEKERE